MFNNTIKFYNINIYNNIKNFLYYFLKKNNNFLILSNFLVFFDFSSNLSADLLLTDQDKIWYKRIVHIIDQYEKLRGDHAVYLKQLKKELGPFGNDYTNLPFNESLYVELNGEFSDEFLNFAVDHIQKSQKICFETGLEAGLEWDDPNISLFEKLTRSLEVQYVDSLDFSSSLPSSASKYYIFLDSRLDLFDVNLMYLMVPAFLLFLIGLVAIGLNRKNILLTLMAIELMLLGISLALTLLSVFFMDPRGFLLVILIMSVAAAEIVIALAICVSLYRLKGSVNLKAVSKLKG